MEYYELIVFILLLLIGLGFNKQPKLKPFAFTFYVLAGVSLALQFPNGFIQWGSFETKKLITTFSNGYRFFKMFVTNTT